MLQKKSFYLFIIAALFILSGATVGLAGAQGGGEVRAVDLLGAWVDGSAPNGDFAFTGTDGNAYTANFEADILPLFTASGVWFDGSQACTDCHFDNSEDSYHEMDLTSYEGIMAGGDVLSHPPGVPLLGQSAVGETDFDWDGSKLRGRLRNNRMPPGWEFDITEANRDGPALETIADWVNDGAPNDDNFTDNVLPLFTAPDAWFDGSEACTDCHFDNSEDSYHEMDLSSYEGIMAGGDVLSHPPGVPLLGQSAVGETDFDWDGAKLRSRLRNNRMPPGWEFDITEENRDGPALVAGHAGGDAPVTLPESGGDNSMMAWILAAVGLVALLAGMAIRRREQVG